MVAIFFLRLNCVRIKSIVKNQFVKKYSKIKLMSTAGTTTKTFSCVGQLSSFKLFGKELCLDFYSQLAWCNLFGDKLMLNCKHFMSAGIKKFPNCLFGQFWDIPCILYWRGIQCSFRLTKINGSSKFVDFPYFTFWLLRKVEYKSVWLAPLVKAPGRIGGIDWAIFFSTEVLIIKCGNYTDLFFIHDPSISQPQK